MNGCWSLRSMICVSVCVCDYMLFSVLFPVLRIVSRIWLNK